jgi:hypothetical protein
MEISKNRATLEDIRNVKPNEFSMQTQSREDSENTEKLQTSVIWEKRKKSEAIVERKVMPEGTIPLGTIRRRREDNIKMDVDWIPLVQSR